MIHLTRSQALCSVLGAGTLWSFGALTIRYMIDPHIFRWQYLFFRGMTIALILCIYLMVKDRSGFVSSFRKMGIPGMIGSFGLVGAFICFIWSITLTTAANTLFLYSTIPFIAAFLGIFILKERLRRMTWVAMTVALIGITVMVIEGLETGSVLGTVTGLGSALGFSIFSVSLRFRKEVPQFASIAVAGILCALLTAWIIHTQDGSVLMPVRNIVLSMVHGSLVGVGLILFSFGARHFPAAELNLISLVEVVGGVVWVYLPIFGIHEIPSFLTIIGGGIVSGAILLNSLGPRNRGEKPSSLPSRR